VGDVVFWYGNGTCEYEKKWKIIKINKCSFTMQLYKCIKDKTDDRNAWRNQTYGKMYYNWTDELTDIKKICYDSNYFVKKGDPDYNDYLKTTSKNVDYGR
jgi:hypothetical protein